MSDKAKQQALMRRALEELRELRAQLADYRQRDCQPVAVLGIGCRFPGGCDSPEALWQFLAEGRNAKTEVPADRWNWPDYYRAEAPAPGKISTRYGAFIDGIDRFDAHFFNITAREAEQMDPQQRLLLQSSWQALERSGIDPKKLRDSRTGIFIGCMTQEYSELIRSDAAIDMHTGSGNAPSVIAGRLAYYYGSQGPALVVDTACSSSLMAVHLAVESLRRGESDLALAGGVNLQLSPRSGITESQAMMLAADGLCKTFDEEADGIGRGDGVGVVVLKRLADALRDGDPVAAVIKGTAANHDGRSSGLTVPSETAQEAVIAAALENAGVSPQQLSYVEAHGTGTALGDPIEVSALHTVLGHRLPEQPLYIGSLKTNFGHTEGAAGIAGFLKLVLMLQRQMLPPHVNFHRPSRRIPWQDMLIRVVDRLMPWTAHPGQPRTAGVSAFGLSGTNVHMVLQEFESTGKTAETEAETPILLKLSARSESSLAALAQNYRFWLQQNPNIPLSEVCYYAATTRSDMAQRAAIVAGGRQPLDQALTALIEHQEHPAVCVAATAAAGPGKLAMLFTGQGAQFSGMGRMLYENWAAFRNAIEECEAHVHGLLDKRLQYLLLDASDEELGQTRYAQPALFAFDYALYRLWQSWGIEPDVVLGHSLGEYVAACVAGVFELSDAIRLVVARAESMQQAPGEGAMLAVTANKEQLDELLSRRQSGLTVAAINSPRHCVLSGELSAIAQAQQDLQAAGIREQRLAVSHAFHSPMMQPAVSVLQTHLTDLPFGQPDRPLIANVSGQVAGDEMRTADYWLEHCLRPVLFAASVETLQTLDIATFVECGPRATLTPLLLANGIARETLISGVSADASDPLLHTAAQFYVKGYELKWPEVLGAKPTAPMPDLPVYPFARQRYWLPPSALEPALQPRRSLHPLLHRRLALAASERVYFESELAISAPAYLAEHRIHGQYLAPLAVLIEMLLAAARQVLECEQLSLFDLRIEYPLILPSAGGVAVQIKVEKTASGHWAAAVFSRHGSADWRKHATAQIDQAVSPAAPAFAEGGDGEPLPAAQVYRLLADKRMVYGPSFQVLQTALRQERIAVADLATAASTEGYLFYPPLLDGCMQTAGIALGEIGDDQTWLPVAIERLDFLQSFSAGQCRAEVSARDADGGRVDLHVTEHGNTALIMRGLSFQSVATAGLSALLEPDPVADWLYQTVWQRLEPAVADTVPELAFIACYGEATAQRLAATLAGPSVNVSVIGPQRLADAAFWHSYLAQCAAAGGRFQVIYCAEDFVGEQPADACLGLLALLQRLDELALNAAVTVLSKHAADASATLCPQLQALSGLVQTAALEFPGRRWKMLAIDDLDTVDRGLLVGLLSTEQGEQQLALQNGDCYGLRLQRLPSQGSEAAVIRPDKTYLVTGGAGALGFTVVKWLAQRGAKTVVVAGRSGLASLPESVLRGMTNEGVDIVGVAADLAEPGGGEILLARLAELPPLAGVVHAAGILADGSLLNLSAADFVVPWRPKVHALRWLDEHLPAQDLEFFVLFSSLAAVTGAPGQGNYAAANAYADALMRNRRRRGLPALTINWGGWSGDGLAARAAERMTANGVDLIDAERGVAVFAGLLAQNAEQVAVMRVRWNEFLQSLPYPPPALYQQFVSEHALAAAPESGFLEQLNQAPCAQRAQLLEDAVRQAIGAVLHAPEDAARLERRQRFFDSGFDSLLAMELANRLARQLQCSLPTTLLFDYPTLEALLEYLQTSLPVAFDEQQGLDALAQCSEQDLAELLAQRLVSMD